MGIVYFMLGVLSGFALIAISEFAILHKEIRELKETLKGEKKHEKISRDYHIDFELLDIRKPYVEVYKHFH